MQYRSLFLAAAFAFPVLCGAGDAATGSAVETDIKVACIIDFIASEQDEDTKDAYLDDCVRKQMATPRTPANKS